MASQAIARLTTHALREPELGRVIDELLDYRGSDIYVHDLDGLGGLSFGDIGQRFDHARPIGLLHADGTVTLAPEPSEPPRPGDRLVLIAPDGTATHARTSPFPAADAPAVAAAFGGPQREARTEHVVVVGWNPLGRALLTSLEEGCAPGSTVEVVYDPDLFDVEGLGLPANARVEVTLTPCPRLTWDPTSVPADVTACVFLAYRRGLSPGEADSRTLLDLMLLRRTLEERSTPLPRTVVELRDPDSIDLAGLSGADDHIVSDALASLLMTQLAEHPERRQVLLTLYAEEGPSLGLVAASDLGLAGEVRFADAVVAASASGMAAIGWRPSSAEDSGVVLNPPVAASARLAPDAQVVVIG